MKKMNGSVRLALLQSDYINSRSLMCYRVEHKGRGLAMARGLQAKKIQITLTPNKGRPQYDLCVHVFVCMQAPPIP